ncbi:hypothetical protein [Metabacillus bambusae]|uniref:Fur-regulated basic protein FbpA n=1 Tax=Metabacillus bambusae TaxID=2795218 RepID=A0ABS3NBC7_9BACI|nr:hypothetical protein [Metabacillus bambusae]MBO1515579.1 hypothetical protein [Metabacillus bambusae]
MKTEQAKRGFVLDELLKRGVTTAQSGTSIMDCNYDELKYELVLASFREIDSGVDSNKWF